jgi:ligand-binding sensor domain-containing protein
MQKMDIRDGLSNNEVKVIREDENGNIWIGTRNGITRISKGGVEDE